MKSEEPSQSFNRQLSTILGIGLASPVTDTLAMMVKRSAAGDDEVSMVKLTSRVADSGVSAAPAAHCRGVDRLLVWWCSTAHIRRVSWLAAAQSASL